MPGRVFVLILVSLIFLLILSSPPVLGPLVRREPTPTLTSTMALPTPTATSTADPFAGVPLATPLSGQVAPLRSLPTPFLGEMPPTFTPTPLTVANLDMLLPDYQATPVLTSLGIMLTMPAGRVGVPPERLHIPRLQLEASVEPVGLVKLDIASGIVAPLVPDHRAAGWLNTSALLGGLDNLVLVGQYDSHGEIFWDLWTLEAGDDIWLYAGEQERRYSVREVIILPEQSQPLEVRLANANYIQPTGVEQLTLVTGWPEKGNTHRTVVVARPEAALNAE